MNINSQVIFVLQRLAELDTRLTLLENLHRCPVEAAEATPVPPPAPVGVVRKVWERITGKYNG